MQTHFFRGYNAALAHEDPEFIHDAYGQRYHDAVSGKETESLDEPREYLNGYSEGMTRALERAKLSIAANLARIAGALESSEPWTVEMRSVS